MIIYVLYIYFGVFMHCSPKTSDIAACQHNYDTSKPYNRAMVASIIIYILYYYFFCHIVYLFLHNIM